MKRIKLLRLVMDKKLVEVGAETGRHYSLFGKMEKGNYPSTPDPDTVEIIESYFGESLESLLSEVEIGDVI